MHFQRLVEIVGNEPVFQSGLLLAGDVRAADVQQQLSRWTRAGRVVQLRRGLYALARPWRKVEPHPFVVSNRLVRGSYVSCEAALSHYGLVPDVAVEVMAVGPGRPQTIVTSFGRFRFRRIAGALCTGYRTENVATDQVAYVATPEKALLDLVHLTDRGDEPAFLESLRLQNLERLDVGALERLAAGRPKLERAARTVVNLIALGAEYEDL